MQKFFLTFAYVGLIKVAPGTFGSLAALIVAVPVLLFLGIESLFLLSFLIFLASITPINSYEKSTGKHDDKSIVIDEVAGIFLAVSLGAWANNSLLNLLFAFVFFRLFDIYKPSIIGRVDKNVQGGLGVMLDDMLAGLFAGLLSAICHGINLRFELIKDPALFVFFNESLKF